jgi:plasmid stability protein
MGGHAADKHARALLCYRVIADSYREAANQEAFVSSLLIRHVDDALRARLKARARAHHRSLEEEARETLRSALARDAGGEVNESLLQLATRLFGPECGVDIDLPPRADDGQRPAPDFSGPEFGR